MYGDYSRVHVAGPTPAQPNPYSAVWAQQGRLLLDAELNEQTAIVLDYLRTLAVDFIGPFGGHIHTAGFKVVVDGDGLAFTPGHYYVHGLRCEAAQTPDLELLDLPFLVYLLVWEQTIGPIQDPTLADPALGPDAGNTTRRSQVAWRAYASPTLPESTDQVTGEESVHEIVEAFAHGNRHPADRPHLRASALSRGAPDDDPNASPAAGRYRGFENQLYRVEIHTGGPCESATFKWSRDNGSVDFALESLSGPDAQGQLIAKLERLWIDARRGLQPGDWVELVDDRWTPAGAPETLLQVETVRQSTREVVLAAGSGMYEFDDASHPYLRRWDQSPTTVADDNAIPVTEVADGEDEWLELEDGVRIQFLAVDAEYQRGDYWLIPARVATGGVLWSRSPDGPRWLPPGGPVRYRAPLALLTPGEDDTVRITDLRTLFTHLAWPEPKPDGDG